MVGSIVLKRKHMAVCAFVDEIDARYELTWIMVADGALWATDGRKLITVPIEVTDDAPDPFWIPSQWLKEMCPTGEKSRVAKIVNDEIFVIGSYSDTKRVSGKVRTDCLWPKIEHLRNYLKPEGKVKVCFNPQILKALAAFDDAGVVLTLPVDLIHEDDDESVIDSPIAFEVEFGLGRGVIMPRELPEQKQKKDFVI